MKYNTCVSALFTYTEFVLGGHYKALDKS